jgi:hypothetical protein
MKFPILFIPPVLLAVVVACQPPTLPPAPPTVAFTSFKNTTSNIVIPANNNVVPANFIAEISSSDRKRVTDIQCFNGGTAVTSGAAYRTACSYSGVTGAPEIRAVATNNDGLTAQATKLVTVDGTPPVASTLQVGGSSFDPTTGSNFSTTVTLGSSALLRVSASGTDILQTFIERDGVRIAQSSGSSVQVQVTPVDNAPFAVGFGVVDTAGNVTKYTVLVTVNQIVGDGVPPVVSISSPAAGATVSGNLIVTVNASDEGGIDKVTLIANNNPVSTTTPAIGSPSVSFALDTLQFENGVLELKAVAVDKSGLSATSGAVLTTVNNIQSPVVSIAAPSNNAQVSGLTTVSVNVRQRASGFDYASAAQCTAAGLPTNCGSIKVDLIDYRGTIVETKFIATANPGSTKLFETTSYDLSAIPNDIYDIKATVSVVVASNTTVDTLSNQILIRNLNANDSPPASIIIAPQRLNELQTTLPTYRQSVGYLAADISDNKGIEFAELRMTCTSCAAGTGPVNALEQYIAFIPPITASRIVMNFNANGTPFLPDGDYTMRLVIQDNEKNRNIQEIKARIDRDPATSNPHTINVVAGFDNEGDKLTPGGATFVVGAAPTTNYSVLNVVTSPSGRIAASTIFGFPVTVNAPSPLAPLPARTFTFTNSFGTSVGFDSVGRWSYLGQVQNMTSGDIYSVSESQGVTKLP